MLKKKLYYISFAEPDRFLSATIVRAASEIGAVKRSSELGTNPGGSAMVIEVPEDHPEYAVFLAAENRVLTKHEALALGKSEKELN